ncbi:MAG: sulfoxide reductase heme-binding subunit YedZ [Acidobacteria bacterium]|nr:sulfoxide reductase heme-binding subunit YedZ [Acidobacteriota bacterium]
MKTILRHPAAKIIVFVLCLAPLLWLGYRWRMNLLGFNRAETIARFTGDCVLRLLLITLAITPLRKLTGWNDLIRFRRMLGLFAFFYGCVHLLHYLWLDKGWFWPEIVEDLQVRRFFIMGLIGWGAMVPLALTSTAWAIRKMGGKKWQLLHRLTYVSAAAGVVHYYWQGKAAILDPLIYGAILIVLLGYRLVAAVLARRPRRAALVTSL